MHYYQFNIGDYIKDTTHLEPMEDLAYRRMIDLYYSTEKALPADIDQIARLTRMRSHSDCIAIVLQDFFTLEDDGYHQFRIDVEIAGYQEKSDKARNSAKARWKKAREQAKVEETQSEGNANALNPQCEGNAKHKPLTKNQEPVTKKETQLDFVDQEVLFDQFWNAGMVKTGKKKCWPIFKKLVSKEKGQDWWTGMLIADIKQRLSSGQLGFDSMHPSTYLNGERWEDDAITSSTGKKSIHDISNQTYESGML